MPSWAKVSWDNTKCRSLSQNKFCIDWHTLKSTRNSIEVLFNFRVKIKLNNYFQMWDRTAGRIYNFVLNCSLFNEYFNCKTINLHDLISNLNLDSTCTKTISRICILGVTVSCIRSFFVGFVYYQLWMILVSLKALIILKLRSKNSL